MIIVTSPAAVTLHSRGVRVFFWMNWDCRMSILHCWQGVRCLLLGPVACSIWRCELVDPLALLCQGPKGSLMNTTRTPAGTQQFRCAGYCAEDREEVTFWVRRVECKNANEKLWKNSCRSMIIGRWLTTTTTITTL